MRTPTNIAIIDHEKKRTFVVHKERLPDAGLYINDSSLLCNLCCSLLSFFKRKNYQEKPRKKSIIVWHTVLWNPWDKGAKVLADFGDEDYKIMLSVDSAVLEKPIILKPSEEWKGCQELSTVSSSYCSGQLDPQMVLHGFS